MENLRIWEHPSHLTLARSQSCWAETIIWFSNGDAYGVALYRSKISRNYLIFGPVNPATINWKDHVNSTININTVCIKYLSIHDLQEHLLLTASAEKYSDPSTSEKLAQTTKEKGILNIMNTTFVDKVNHKFSVYGLYYTTVLQRGSMLLRQDV